MLDDYDDEPARFIRFPLPCADGMCWGVDCRRGSRLCDRNREPEEDFMEINAIKTVKVNAKTLKIHLKVRDEFSASIEDADGYVIWRQEDGYVPDFMPGPHYGDYVMLDIDLDTGQVTNWKKIAPEAIEELLAKKDE